MAADGRGTKNSRISIGVIRERKKKSPFSRPKQPPKKKLKTGTE